MNDTTTHLYQALQREILERAKILHSIINLAISFLFVSLIVFFVFKLFLVSKETIQWYLLSLPPIFAFLSFNYQANGLTLEIALRYTQYLFENDLRDIEDWRPYYIERKAKGKLVAFSKTLPLLLPQFIPIVMLVFRQITFSNFSMQALFVADTLLLLLTVVNFRYKLTYKGK